MIDQNLVARPFIDANGNEEWFTPRDLIYGRTPTQPIDVDVDDPDSAEESTAPITSEAMKAVFRATEARYGPKCFPSKTGMRRGDPNPNHPDNWPSSTSEDASDPPLPSRRHKNGERGRSMRRNIDAESVDENVDDIIREQLSEDARQSSSSVAEVPRPKASSPLSDSDYSARRSRSDALFEGYRRVKRTRTTLHSRDAEQAAISSFGSPPIRWLNLHPAGPGLLSPRLLQLNMTRRWENFDVKFER